MKLVPVSRFSRFPALAVMILALLACAFGAHARQLPTVGTNQDVLVVCVKFSDLNGSRKASCQDWVDTLNAEVNPFYSAVSRGQLSFRFSTYQNGPADGWLPMARASTDGFFGVGQTREVMPLVDPLVDFGVTPFDRMLVITNNGSFFGQAPGLPGYQWMPVQDGIENQIDFGAGMTGARFMSVAIINEWVGGVPMERAVSNVVHELGHNLGVPVHYGGVIHDGIARGLISPWSIMGFERTPPSHFLAFTKWRSGWFTNAWVETIDPPMGQSIDRVVRLSPHSVPGSAGTFHLLSLPFAAGATPFQGYLLELRDGSNADDVPEQGVIIALVDETPQSFAKYWIEDDPDSPGNRNKAAYEVGDVFEDPQRGLRVEVLGQFNDGWDVRVQWQLPANRRPDPRITPWGGPPWETPDIWIDSEKNGWDTYQFVDSAGVPTGNGDEPWVDRDNRVYFRVRNSGPGDATQIRADVYVAASGIGDAGNRWSFLGSHIISHIPAGGSVTGTVNWRPAQAVHSCLKVVIQPHPDELDLDNNAAQENIFVFETERNSPWHPRTEVLEIHNPLSTKELEVSVTVRDLPPDWAFELYPSEFTLPAGGTELVKMVVHPGGPPGGPETEGYDPGFVGRPKVEAWVPFEDTFVPLGGVESWTHLTIPTELEAVAFTDSGNTAGASGCISPAVEGRRIALELLHSGGLREVVFVDTDAEGCFKGAQEGLKAGTWSVQAWHEGSGPWSSSESKVTKVVVK